MPVGDDPVIALAERLLACLCEVLPSTVGGDVCVCCLNPGVETPMDYCCECTVGDQPAEGQAWVSVVKIFPSTRFPAQQLDRAACGQGSGFVAELVMGVYRCAPVSDARGNPPTCDQQMAVTEKILSDAAAMRQAVRCCFRDEVEAPDVLIGEWVPLGPQGGCAGGAQLVTVGFADCCPDDSM